jgi:hypothetical protein
VHARHSVRASPPARIDDPPPRLAAPPRLPSTLRAADEARATPAAPSFRTTQRDPANPVSVPWSGLATDSAPEYESWVLTLSTRAVPLTKTAVENFGLELDDHGVVTDLNFEPDGEPGPAELSQVRIQQKVVEVNGVAVSSKAEIVAVLHPERLVGGWTRPCSRLRGWGSRRSERTSRRRTTWRGSRRRRRVSR